MRRVRTAHASPTSQLTIPLKGTGSKPRWCGQCPEGRLRRPGAGPTSVHLLLSRRAPVGPPLASTVRSHEPSVSNPAWRCQLCQESVDGDMSTCWNCGATRSGRPDPNFRNVGTYQPAARYCCVCHHDLTGIDSLKCPECGNTFDPEEPGTFAEESRRRRRHRIVLVWLCAFTWVIGLIAHLVWQSTLR